MVNGGRKKGGSVNITTPAMSDSGRGMGVMKSHIYPDKDPALWIKLTGKRCPAPTVTMKIDQEIDDHQRKWSNGYQTV